jgi:hypothetical protein
MLSTCNHTIVVVVLSINDKHTLPVNMPTSSTKIIGKGTVNLGSENVKVGKILLVEDLKHNLLSVNKISDQGYTLMFESRKGYPSHWFWTARLMKVFGHEGQCTCRHNTHGWIVYIILFPVVGGTSRGSSWLRRNEFLKMTK